MIERSPGRDDPAPASPSQGAATPQMVKGELRAFLRSHEQRRSQLPRAIVLGVRSGFAAVAFTRVLAMTAEHRTRLIESAHAYPGWGMAVPVLVGALGAAVAVWIVRRFAPEASGSGIPHLEAVLHHLQSMRGLRVPAGQFPGGVGGIGGGVALRRQGAASP